VLKNSAQPLAGKNCSSYLAAKRLPGGQLPAAASSQQSPSLDFEEKPMKFRPLHDRVVVKRIDAEERTAGGIIIPDTAKEKPSQGEIIAVGPGGRDENGKLIPIDVHAGDRVLFGKWSGTEVKIDGVDYLIMKESDVMGVLEGTAAKKKAA
jgi:chaperonin GroES